MGAGVILGAHAVRRRPLSGEMGIAHASFLPSVLVLASARQITSADARVSSFDSRSPRDQAVRAIVRSRVVPRRLDGTWERC